MCIRDRYNKTVDGINETVHVSPVGQSTSNEKLQLIELTSGYLPYYFQLPETVATDYSLQPLEQLSADGLPPRNWVPYYPKKRKQ